MKRFILLLCAGVCLAFAPGSYAQEKSHIEAGVFADYFRLSQTKTSFVGAGARLSFGLFPHVKLEAEMSYDFSRTFTEGFNDTTTGTLTFQNSNVHILHGLFGPKIELGHTRIRPFVVAKGGFTNFGFSRGPVTTDTVFSQINGLRTSNVNALFYPGGGLEGFFGPVGVRLEVGDEMYFNNGTHNNLRVTFGPYIRF